MAEVTAFRNNATEYPIYGLPYTLAFPILDADGDVVTGATGLDSEVSLNGDTPADCTNEATEIGTSGQYYLSLTAAEVTADIVSGVTKTSSSGAKTTCWDLYPRKLPVLLTSDNAGAYDSTTTINLGAGASSIDDFYNGCIVYIYTGTGNGQVRMITDYVGSTKIATVHVAWATNPDATSDLKIYRTELAPYVAGTPQTGDVYPVATNVTYGFSALSARIPAALTANGNMKASLVEILTTALTETSGYIAAAFKKLFNVATPVLTCESVNQTANNGDIKFVLDSLIDEEDGSYLFTGLALSRVYQFLDTTSVPLQTLTNATYGLSALSARIPSALVGGNIPAVVKAQDNIDFGALQKASLNAATPAVTVSDKTGFSLSTAGIKAIYDFLTVDITAAIASFGNLFKTNIDGKISEAGGGLDAAGVRGALGMGSANLDTQLSGISNKLPDALQNGNIKAAVKEQDNIDFGALQKESLDNSSPTVSVSIAAQDIRDALGMAEANLDDQLEAIALQISALGTGTGPVEKPYYVSSNSAPCGDVLVIMSLDNARAYPIHKGTTDATGWVKFYPNVPAGTKVYMWSFKTGQDFINPDEEEV
jgi:hypothetical protein